MRKQIIAANWKMNVLSHDINDLITSIKSHETGSNLEIIIAAPFVYLKQLVESVSGTSIQIAAQNVHSELQGAYTGEISVKMLNDISVSHCLIGHSERRQYFFEEDLLIRKKLILLFENQIVPIVCIGETLEERETDKTEDVIAKQLSTIFKNINSDLSKIIIAYEPVWAIGTGKTASPEQAEAVHLFIRNWIRKRFGESQASAIRVIYGGSMNPSNAQSLLDMENIDGGLIGSASQNPAQFSELIQAGQK